MLSGASPASGHLRADSRLKLRSARSKVPALSALRLWCKIHSAADSALECLFVFFPICLPRLISKEFYFVSFFFALVRIACIRTTRHLEVNSKHSGIGSTRPNPFPPIDGGTGWETSGKLQPLFVSVKFKLCTFRIRITDPYGWFISWLR